MKISACMIAKNEEKVIARCIESYRAVVDEVIVVDTGSDDQTVAIAQQLGAKVFHFVWQNDFSAAKNFAISKAKGDWIIFLDADEYFAADTVENVRPFLKSIDKTFNVIICKIINIDEDGKSLHEIIQIRIFKNDRHFRYVNAIHEMLSSTNKNKRIRAIIADSSKILLYHTGYSRNNRENKAKRNLKMLIEELPQASKKPAFYQYISDCYYVLKEWAKAIEYAELFLASGVNFIGYNTKPYQNIIESMSQLQYTSEEIMARISQAIERFPQHPLFYLYKGNLHYDLKQYDFALNEYETHLKLQACYDDIEFNSTLASIHHVYFHMGVINEYRNVIDMAVEYYLNTLKIDNHIEPCFDKMMLLIRTQPAQEIIAFLNVLYDIDNEDDLDFLSTRLANHAVPQVLAYYTNLREKKYAKQDFVVLQMLVANKYYDKAFPTLLDCYLEDGERRFANVAATIAMLSGNNEYIARCIETLPPSLTKIINAYYGTSQKFYDEDKPAFLKLMHLFILWADDADVERLSILADEFSGGLAVEMGNLFLKEGYYQIGAQFYDYALTKHADVNRPAERASLYFNLGYCLHRTNDCYAAAQAFVNAYESGYRKNDIYEFLRWNVSQLDASSSMGVRIKEILQNRVENDERRVANEGSYTCGRLGYANQ